METLSYCLACDVCTNTWKSYFEVLCINSLSRSKRVNTTPVQLKTPFEHHLCALCGAFVVNSCAHLAQCCVSDKYGSEIYC